MFGDIIVVLSLVGGFAYAIEMLWDLVVELQHYKHTISFWLNDWELKEVRAICGWEEIKSKDENVKQESGAKARNLTWNEFFSIIGEKRGFKIKGHTAFQVDFATGQGWFAAGIWPKKRIFSFSWINEGKGYLAELFKQFR